jgi:hypothetical protein
MWCEAIQEKLQSCVCRHYEKKTKYKNKAAISPESVVDEADLDIEDMTKRKIPALVMWYRLVIDRLKHVFSIPRDAGLVRWHSEKRRENDKEIGHPTDGTQWNFFDLQYPEFSAETRNIRFALSTDGMNPFGENRTMHSTWRVILVMYNIPTWLCHKRKYLMLSILIQGPKQADIDIDVFLEPLMEDMTMLLNEGVRMWDQYQHEYFTLKAIIFVCIHDAPEALQYHGKLKERADVRFEWMELHQFTFHHPENWCSCDTDGS